MSRQTGSSKALVPFSSAWFMVISLWFSFCCLFIRDVSADCECGYSAAIGDLAYPYVFTDLIETDFTKIDDVSQDTDWQRQAFNVSAADARGEFGEMVLVDNVVSGGGGTGLQLIVRSDVVDDMVPTAEIDSSRLDLLSGTFRASMKLTNVSGTCAAFFWYYNDTQEIDMEFLSNEFNSTNDTYPVNLVLQSREAAEAGYNAQATPNFKKVNLPFNPTIDFHEYRIDFLPGTVFFYADGQVLAEMTGSAVPTHQGHLILQHWSNGNPLWSGGPPATDATLTVAYVKAYFNSSDLQRQDDWVRRCSNQSVPGATCAIPDVTAANTSAEGFFFSNQPNMTGNQTVYGKSGADGSRRLWWPVLGVTVFMGGWTFGLLS